MIRYAALRLASAVPVLWIVASATFALLRFLPGGPFDTEKSLPPEIQRNVEARYGLDRPLAEQYAAYLAGLLRGDLGPSYKYLGRDARDVIADALLAVVTYFGPVLALLLTGSFVVEKIFAIPGLGGFFVSAVTDRLENHR